MQSGLRFCDGGSNIKVYNNIVYTTGGAVRLVSQEHDNAGLALDYNDYWAAGASQTLWVWGGGTPQYTETGATTYSSYAAFRTGTGQETHGYWGNPGLVSAGSMPTLSSASKPLTATLLNSLSGYKLSSTTSAAANRGVTPSTVGISPGLRDFYGDTIPAGTAFSMGAQDR